MNNQHKAKVCPVCSGETFEWGILRLASYRTGLGIIGGGAKAVKAQRCLTCSFLLMYTDDALTRRDQLLGLTKATLKLAIPVLIIGLIAHPIVALLQGLRVFSDQTMQMKTQLDTLSQQIDKASRFSLPSLFAPSGAAKHKQDEKAA